MMGGTVVEQADHRRGGDLLFLTMAQAAPGPGQRSIEVEPCAAMVGFPVDGGAAPDPAMGGPAGVGGMAAVHEVEWRIRPGGLHQRDERGVEEGLLEGRIRLGGHAFGLVEHDADLPEKPRHRVRGIGQAEGGLDLSADHLGRLRHLGCDPGRQGGALIGRQARDPSRAAQALHPGPAALKLERARLGHGAFVERQGCRNPRQAPAVVEQKQNGQAPMHGAVELPPHQRQEMGAILK